MYDKLINKAEKNAKKAFDEELKRRRKSILSSLEMFQTVAGVILDKRVDDENVRSVVFSFTRHFLPPAQSQTPKVDEICAIIAARQRFTK